MLGQLQSQDDLQGDTSLTQFLQVSNDYLGGTCWVLDMTVQGFKDSRI